MSKGCSLALLGALAVCSAGGLAKPAGAVLLLDDTWQAFGGSPKHWDRGFDEAVALAAEPQFAAVVAMGGPDPDEGHSCSGTWLGNDEKGHAFVLTAAHCFVEVKATEEPEDTEPWVFRTDGGSALGEVARTIHPRYDESEGDATGYDMAVAELDGPIEDSGDPPVLYAGNRERGHVGTLVGYGMRRTGRYGEDWKFNGDSGKAAARNVIDSAEPPAPTGTDGNILMTDFDRPGGVESELDGDGEPTDILEGTLGGGDSGGSLWIRTAGGWRVAGVNSRGGAEEGEQYGMVDDFARVSTQLAWLRTVFPGLRTGR